MSYGDRDPEKRGYVLLAEIDEADSYEIDANAIWYHTKKDTFLWRSASGCSCWDGEWDEEEYDSLSAIEVAMTDTTRVGGNYNPTLKGAEQLLTEAREAYARTRTLD